MHTVTTHPAHVIKSVAAALLALVSLAGLLTPSAEARSGSGPGQIVFVAGKAERCRGEACNRFDVIRSVTPHSRGERRVALISSAVETASNERGTIAVLSKNVAGGGANSNAFTNVYLLTPDGKRRAVFRHRREGFYATGLGISGNGKLLVLAARNGKFSSDKSKLWLVRADGSGLRQLTTGPGNDEMPALSPDGKRIVFSRTFGDSRKPELYTMPTAGGEAVWLTENGVSDVNPVFSPNGRSIAFGQYNERTRRGSVAVIRADGSGLRTVTSTGGEYPDPDYSPSGRSIAFVGEVPGGRGGFENALYTVRASGGARSLVTRASEDPGLPQWTLRR